MKYHEMGNYHFVYGVTSEYDSFPVPFCRDALFQHSKLLERL